jgi:hypothetical protein
MRHEIEPLLTFRRHSGGQDYYDCPQCAVKDPTGQLVVNWDKETYICNHMSSCGISGHLSQLVKILGIKTIMEKPAFIKPEKPKPVYKLKDLKPCKVKLQTTKKVEIDDVARIRQLESLFCFDIPLIVCRNTNYGELIEKQVCELEYDTDNFTHFKVNYGGTKIDDIKDFKYTLVECDDIADMSVQLSYLESLELPCASIVYSGNKSLHAVVKIEAPNVDEYKRRVNVLHDVCLQSGFKIDKTKDACRFTRLAGAINNKTGKLQELIKLNSGAHSWNQWENEVLPKFLVTENTVNSSSLQMESIKSGYSSGFATYDYNDSGLKGGTLCLLTGKRNQGKTTFSRQLVVAMAMQKQKSFVWYGEGDASYEKGYLVRLIAQPEEIIAEDNGYGRTIYRANTQAEERYNLDYGPYIDMYVKPISLQIPVFDDLMQRMTDKARQGTKLFVIDNMMKLTADQYDTFKAQQRIVSKLKEFADKFGVYVCLIAHPKKGEGDQSISGAMEQENTADTILRFKRVFFTEEANFDDDFPPHELKKVTALILVEKVRNAGETHKMYLEFDQVRQANIEIAYLDTTKENAKDYRDCGYFSRPVSYVGL